MTEHAKLPGRESQSGQIAILTVVIFMLLFSIVVVSFTRIMVAASHEATSDELRAQALAAAESGVEDAKRILNYCYSNPLASGCDKVLGSTGDQACDDIIGSNLPSALGLTVENNQVKVGQESDQHYLCVKIATRTQYYYGSAADGTSDIVPLNLRNISGITDPVRDIQIEWHSPIGTDIGGDGPVGSLIAGTDLPSAPKWRDVNSPSALRVEMIGIPNGAFSIDQLTTVSTSAITGTWAWTLRPSTSGAFTSPGSGYDITYLTASPNPNTIMTSPLIATKCTASSTATYACAFTFKYGNGAGTGWALPNDHVGYYLRIQPIYGPTHFRVSAYNPSGQMLYFDGVQPYVDVTGRSVDSFQRLGSWLKPSGDSGDGWFPEYAVDSGGKICKDMSVRAADGDNNCTYN